MTVEDLQNNGYKICQDDDLFKFGIDSVLLSDFVYEKINSKFEKKKIKNEVFNVFDLCTGNAIIPILTHCKLTKGIYKNTIKITGIEINEKSYNIALNSLDINSQFGVLEDVNIINDDLKNIFLDRNQYSKFYQQFDVVTVNPPYIKKGSGLKNDNENNLIARSEEKCNFDDICNAAQKLLLTKGSFIFIQKTFRLAEIICTLKKYCLEPKNLTLIQSNSNTPSELFLMEAIKNGGEELHVSPAKIIY